MSVQQDVSIDVLLQWIPLCVAVIQATISCLTNRTVLVSTVTPLYIRRQEYISSESVQLP